MIAVMAILVPSILLSTVVAAVVMMPVLSLLE
jgi:hypothetical protein